jgi:hypothetical protein
VLAPLGCSGRSRAAVLSSSSPAETFPSLSSTSPCLPT